MRGSPRSGGAAAHPGPRPRPLPAGAAPTLGLAEVQGVVRHRHAGRLPRVHLPSGVEVALAVGGPGPLLLRGLLGCPARPGHGLQHQQQQQRQRRRRPRSLSPPAAAQPTGSARVLHGGSGEAGPRREALRTSVRPLAALGMRAQPAWPSWRERGGSERRAGAAAPDGCCRREKGRGRGAPHGRHVRATCQSLEGAVRTRCQALLPPSHLRNVGAWGPEALSLAWARPVTERLIAPGPVTDGQPQGPAIVPPSAGTMRACTQRRLSTW